MLVGLELCLLYLSSVIFKKFNPLLAITFFWTIAIALPYCVIPDLIFKGQDLSTVLAFQSQVQDATIYFLLITLSLAFLRDSETKYVKNGLIVCAWADSLIMTSQFSVGREPYFLFNNPAIDVSFLCCVAPFIWGEINKKIQQKLVSILTMFVYLAPCFYTKTSSGILGLGAMLWSLVWAYNKFQRKYFLIGVYASILVAWAGYVFQGMVLTSDSGRFTIWKLAFNHWLANGFWVGLGPGTFQLYGPALQIENKLGIQGDTLIAFTWLHNDWLQVAFETGLIGLILALLVWLFGLLFSRKNPLVFSSLFTYGVLGIVQMPLRHFLFGFLGAFIILQAFRPSKEC